MQLYFIILYCQALTKIAPKQSHMFCLLPKNWRWILKPFPKLQDAKIFQLEVIIRTLQYFIEVLTTVLHGFCKSNFIF